MTPSLRLAAWTLAACVIAVAYWEHAMLTDLQRETQATADRATKLADKFAGIITHCANEGAFAIDDLLIFCDRQKVRVAAQ